MVCCGGETSQREVRQFGGGGRPPVAVGPVVATCETTVERRRDGGFLALVGIAAEVTFDVVAARDVSDESRALFSAPAVDDE